MIRFVANTCMPLVFSLLLAACAAGTPSAPQGSGQTAAPGGPPVKPGNDACALLTDDEITQVTGFTVLSKAPAVPFGGTGGCQWALDSGTEGLTWDIALDIHSPGGRSDFDEYLSFTDDEEHITGLGDDAVKGVASSVIAVKGDTQVDLQFVAFYEGAAEIPQRLVEVILTKL